MENKTDQKIITVSEDQLGLRLDKFLGQIDFIGSRSRSEYLIENGCILVNNKVVKSSYKVKTGDIVQITIPKIEKPSLSTLNMKLDIVFEDSDLIVVNKPVGLVVHPAVGHQSDTLVNALIGHTNELAMKFGEDRPGIIHRLDKDTSGLLVVAKNDFSQERISQQFKDRTIHRIYYAICLGIPPKLEGTIHSFLARHPRDRKKYASLRDSKNLIIRDKQEDPGLGKWAVTHYKVLQRNTAGLSYLQLKLETGRTHQIRVHLSEMGWPLLGDSIYTASNKIKNIQGSKNQELLKLAPRCALHAAELGFSHPRTKENLFFKIDWPDYQEIRTHFFT